MPLIDKQFNEKIRKICEKSPCSCGTILKFKHEVHYLYDYIMKFSEHLPDLPFTARIWFALNGITDYVKCKKCGKDLPHGRKCRPLTGYDSLYCSQECSQSSDEHKLHLRNLCQSKYGVDHPSQCPEIKKHISEGHLNRSEDAIRASNEKRANTNIDKYGVKAPSQRPEIAKQCGETQRNRSPEEKAKTNADRKKTFLERYGDENYRNVEKSKATFKRHCEEDPNFKKDIDDRTRKTLIGKYGVDCALKMEKCIGNGKKFRCRQKYNETILANSLVEPMFDLEFYTEHFNESLPWKCKKCGHEFSQRIREHQPFMARCEKCFPLTDATSNAEKDVLDFVKTLYSGEIIENSRNVISPKELDIYLPEKSLAIEFDGLFWHSENQGTPANYHVSKTEECEKRGIRLIHIFENEWLMKRKIVESRLADVLGSYEHTVFARKCVISDVQTSDARGFLDENHIQGNCPSKVRLGLYFNGKLLALMTFGKCRFDRKHEWEMLRFCTKLGYHIPGAAGKLLRHFEIAYSPKSLVTYADRRWSQGKLYMALNFKLVHISKPDYWYWSHKNAVKILESRIKYQKHKLSRLIATFDPEKSEKENMFINGFYRIFDCGNYVFEKIYGTTA